MMLRPLTALMDLPVISAVSAQVRQSVTSTIKVDLEAGYLGFTTGMSWSF